MTSPRDRLDRIVRTLDAALVVVTASDGDEDVGCLVGFHSQSGIDPLRWALWISEANHSHSVLCTADIVAVHFLAGGDHDLADLFGARTGEDIDKFVRCDVVREGGVPVLRRCGTRFLARTVATAVVDGGDHTCITVVPFDVHTDPDFRPLRLVEVDDLSAGHPAGE